MLEPKIMNVYYGTDLLPYKDKERSVHYPITSGSVFTGASNSTEIRFYVDQIGDLDLTWVANAKLPNGKTGSKVLTGGTDENGTYVSLFLESWFTQVIGDLYIGLQGYNGGINYEYDSDTGLYSIHGTPTIQATGVLKVHIAYSTPYNGESDVLETDIQDFLAFATAIMAKQITVVSDISTEDISSYATGHIFYDKETNQFYTKTSTSPYYTIYKLLPVIEITNATTSLSLDEVLALESFPSYIIKNGMLYVHSGTDQSEMYFDRLDGYGTYITDNGNCTMYFPTIVVKNSHAPVGEVGDIAIIERDATWYTKQQIDNELTNFVTLATTQTISGDKTFSGQVEFDSSSNISINSASFVVDSPTTFEDRVDIYANAYLYDEVEITTRTNNQIHRGFGLYMQGDNELVLYETVDNGVLMEYYFYHDQVEPNELYVGNATGDTDMFVSGSFNALSVISNEYKIGRYKLKHNINSGDPTTISLCVGEQENGSYVYKEWIRFTHYPTNPSANDDTIEIGTPSGNETIVSVNGEVNADRLEANTAKVATIQHPTTTSNTIAVNSPITVQTPTTDSNPATKKYVDDSITDVMEVAEGKCTTYVLSYADTIAIAKQQTSPSSPNMKFYVWNSTSKQWEDKTTELHNGDYDNVNIYNSGFNSQNNIGDTQRYLIFRSIGREERYSTSPGNFYMYYLDPAINDLFKTGDIFLVIETDVPDRWYAGGNTPYSFYKLETSKIDLTSYVTTNTTQTITGAKTFTGDIVFKSSVSGNEHVTFEDEYVQMEYGLQLYNYDTQQYEVVLIGGTDGGDFGFPSFNTTVGFSNNVEIWGDITLDGELNDRTNSFTIAQGMAQFNPTEVDTNSEIKWTKMLSFSKSADTTFTFETAKTNCLNEYKAIITNSGSSAITLTFTGVSVIKTNDDSISIASNTLSLPASTTIEVNICNGKMIAFNWGA